MDQGHAVGQRYFTVKQAANYLGMSELALRSMIKRKQVDECLVRIGNRIRLDFERLQSWIEKQRVA